MGTPAVARFTRILWRIIRIFTRIVFWLLAIFGLVTLFALVALSFFMPSKSVDPATASLVYSAAKEGKIAYKLTVPEELKVLLGPAIAETTVNDGGMQKLILDWPGINAAFIKMRDYSAPFTLLYMNVGGKSIRIGNFTDVFGGMPVDIGRDRAIVLRNEDDLKKFDPFWGFANVSLANLDLREHRKLLETMPFDNQTVWPKPDKMPEEFDPASLLEEGKNPGLGIRRLHEQGIDGQGVGIAIIDQPLLRDHVEYADKIVHYKAKGLMAGFIPPQMHGSPVTSIAAGKNCGVAPAAKVFYFAVPMWKSDNQPYCDVINEIIKLNQRAKISEKIRVISISTGMFPQQANFDRWKESLARAEKQGILVVTCDPAFLGYGTLSCIIGKDPDNPSSYRRGRYTANNVLFVPAGNRTIASYRGPKVYTYDRTGGMSWAAPYLAGLAALAYQVDTEIEPKTIIDFWLKTAVQTDVGPIVNPAGFIEAVRGLKMERNSK